MSPGFKTGIANKFILLLWDVWKNEPRRRTEKSSSMAGLIQWVRCVVTRAERRNLQAAATTTPEALQQRFARSRFLTFDSDHGLTRIHVSTPDCTAMVYLQGAHLAAFQPAGEQPVIFMSSKSDLAPGKALRGGVPVVFPWFAGDKKNDRMDGHPGPSHGFARIQDWSLDSATMDGREAELVFTLGSTELSRRMGFDHFLLTMGFRFGRTLTEELTVRNDGTAPLEFEEAMHAYFHVADIHETTIYGLEGARFIDKVDHFTLKPATLTPLTFDSRTDRVYLDTTGPYRIRDGAAGRTLYVSKQGSQSTITWNNFGPLPDLGEWEWHSYVALETANVDANHIALAPGSSHAMAMMVEVKRER
jgi:glucose-6-phosphate 1-epimerase